MQDTSFPNHIAIIPDGNRRWAKAHNKLALQGHMEGYERAKEIISYAKSSGVKILTLWVFSTENWSRNKDEVTDLFGVIKRGLQELHNEARTQKSKIIHIGRRDRVGGDICQLMASVEEETKECIDFCLCIALDYGGEDEVLRAEERLRVSGDDNKSVGDFLDTTFLDVPSPDLIIRTGGEFRTSGFMPLQSTYSEWVFEEKMFPDFDTQAFQSAIDKYNSRTRRFGK